MWGSDFLGLYYKQPLSAVHVNHARICPHPIVNRLVGRGFAVGLNFYKWRKYDNFAIYTIDKSSVKKVMMIC